MRQTCTIKLTRCFTLGAGLIWFLHSIIYGLFLNINPSLGCIITNPTMTLYSSCFFYPVLYGPLPILIASLSSLFAFNNVRRIVRRQVPIVRRRLDQQMTAMVLMRVVFFVIFTLPYAIYRIYSINIPNPQSNVLQYAIRQLLQAFFTSWTGVNFAVTFYIFAASSARFRRQVKYLIRKYWRQWKNCSFYAAQNQVGPINTVSGNSDIDLE
ncbi:unnamed protein product [Adineta steineri]|uniref:G-protein coupled receptors family 1 profile domain-containing protein n=1 Tax=Adineta steineri TaxID=433720 RepID=A0A819HSK0_9BILA|nr:unnamed protein product [Adineta steineri]